ncbi:hypothetical protein Tco_0780410 [Tanacetum coccineum]
MSNLKFPETHNLVAVLEKPKESDGFEGIIDFLNASSIRYALTVNPTIYTSCNKQFWATAKAKTVNGEVHIQALVDGKKVIVTKTSVRRTLQLKDAEGTECLPNATIFAELERMGYENLTQKLTFYKAFFSPQWKFLIHTILQCLSAKTTAWNEFSSTMASAIICLATNQKFNFSKYIFDNMVKNLEGGVKFLMYPRFVQVFLDKQVEGMTKHKEIYVTPSHTKKVFANMKREGKGFSGRVTPLFQTMMVQAPKELGEGSKIPTDPQHTPTINQPSLSQPPKKQKPRKTKKQNTKVSQPSDPTQPMADEIVDVESVPIHSNDPLLSGEDRLKLNELIELCTNLSQRVLDLENTKTSQAVEIDKLKEKVKNLERRSNSRTLGLKRLKKVGRTARIESSKDEGLGAQEDASKQGRKIDDLDVDAEVTLVDEAQERNDDNLMFDTRVFDDQEVEVEKRSKQLNLRLLQVATTTTTVVTRPKARGVVVQEPSEFRTTTSSSQTSQLPQAKDKGKAKMIKPEKPLKKKDQILDNTQAMMEANYELAQRLQAEEQGELTIKERSKLFIELMDKRRKHFSKLRAEEIRKKPPTKAQKRNQIYSFIPMDTKVVEGSKNQAEGSKKRTREELESDNSKKQKIDENVEAEVDDEAEMKNLMEIVPDDEVAIDAIPLVINSRRYSSMIRMLQNIDREDLETLWKLVKAKHGSTRPEEAYERVLWDDLKVMFKPDVESEVLKNLQGYNVTVWKLFSSSGVHFVRFQNLHIFMLVEKKYPLTPATIIKILNKKLSN